MINAGLIILHTILCFFAGFATATVIWYRRLYARDQFEKRLDGTTEQY